MLKNKSVANARIYRVPDFIHFPPLMTAFSKVRHFLMRQPMLSSSFSLLQFKNVCTESRMRWIEFYLKGSSIRNPS